MKIGFVVKIAIFVFVLPVCADQKDDQAQRELRQETIRLYSASILFPQIEPTIPSARNLSSADCLYVNTSRGRGGLESGVVSDACLKK